MKISSSNLNRYFTLGIFCIAFFTYSTALGQSQQEAVSPKPVHKITPVKILHQPKPSYGDGQDCSIGTVTLRVQFLASGQIGEVKLVSGLTKNRNDSAISAAKDIQFEPATKDGKAVTAAKIVQFAFTFY